MSAVVALGSLVAGCGLVTGPDSATRLEYEVDVLEVVHVDEEWAEYPIAYLRAGLVTANNSGDSITLSIPDCVLPWEAFRPSDPAAAALPVWQARTRLGWPGSLPSGCFAGLEVTVAPGETARGLTTELPLAQILGDSLAPGRYRFEVRIEGEMLAWGSVRAENTRVELGEVHLPESRYPLSVGYPRDGFYYRVRVQPGVGPEVGATARLEVTHTAHHAGPLTRDFAAGCPFRILAFSAADDGEAIPMREPLWSWPAEPTCDTTVLPVTLGPAEQWASELSVPRSVTEVEGASIEDLYFVVVVDVDGRPIRFTTEP